MYLLDFVLVFFLLTINLSTDNVQCELSTEDGNDQQQVDNDELDGLKEVFYRNLMADMRMESGETLTVTPELENRMEERIQSFLRATDGMSSKVRRRRQVVHNQSLEPQARPNIASHEKIYAETAEAEHRYLKGFRERGSVPVSFPLDICLLKVGQSIFAASLHLRKSKDTYTNNTIVTFYKRDHGQFHKYMEYMAAQSRYFDCISHASIGFIAVVNYYNNTDNLDSPETHPGYEEGSPVFKIQEDGTTEIIQKFHQSNQNTVHMWITGNHFYLTHTYTDLNENDDNKCPLYRWTGYHFDVIDELPCYNSINIEPFSIEQTLYIAIANQMNDVSVEEDTFSDIFRFNYEQQKFEFHQKIYIYSVSDIVYFFLELGDVREHFLMTGNSRAGRETGSHKLDYDQHSIVYKFVEGYFVPVQKIELHRVKMFLPVMRENGEFLLLIRCIGKPLLIYEFDGWKFVPSRIDYTRNAFSTGVSFMRVYRHILNTSLIVIANERNFGNTANIFSPIYGVENNLRDVYGQFISWCSDTTTQLESVNLEDIYNKLVALPKISGSGVTIDRDVEIKGSSVEKIRTKVLHTKEFMFKQEAFDYLNNVHRQLQALKQKASKLRNLIDGSLKLSEAMEVRGDVRVPQVIAADGLVRDLEAKNVNDEHIVARVANQSEHEDIINVDRLVIEDRLAVKFLNGYASDTLIRTTDDLRYLKGLDLHAKEVEIQGELFVDKAFDGVHVSADNVLLRGVDQVFKARTLRATNLTVGNLVSSTLNSTDVGSIMSYLDRATEYDTAQGRSAESYPKKFKEIRVEDLEISGLVNDVDISYIDKNALKVVGDQIINGNMNFDNIVTKKLETSNKRLSGVDLNYLVMTVPTEEQQDFTVRQDVHFANPVYMENLHVDMRINHISVIDDQLQVLLKNPKEPQLITGTKSFDNVQLQGPIHLQGKINSSSLSKLNPVSTIHQDVYLEGDYEISGDVTIRRLLNTSNIYGSSQTLNFYDLYRHGLPLSAAAADQNFVFKEPLVVQHVFTNNLNDVNPSDFIPIPSNKLQRITGRKIFNGDLTIRGDRVDAAVINDIDLKQLNQTILKKTGDQIVEGSIHFKELIASTVATKNALFEELPLSTLLTVNTNQRIKSKIRCVNCKLTVHGDLNVDRLVPLNNSRIFGYDLDTMFSDTLRKSYDVVDTISVTAGKGFYNVSVGELILLDQATINGVDLVGLKKINDPLEKDVIVEETLILKNPLHVRNVYFNGSINGVHREEFGHSWLLNEYNQTFTAPQIFENVAAEEVVVDGYFNGVKLEEVSQDLYYLDRSEQLPEAIFHEGIVSYQPIVVKGSVSGLNLATDVLLNNSPKRQYLKDVKIDGKLICSSRIHVEHSLNGMHYAKMREFVTTSGGEKPMNVEVQGNVHFIFQPHVAQLNGYNLEQLHRDVWLANRDEVLTGSYCFENVNFASYVHTKGPVNQLDLEETVHTYLSVSKPQNVTTPIVFVGPVEFKKMATYGSIVLEGLLKGTKESRGINIKEFDKYVLKKDVDQIITGKWVFHDAEVYGNLNLSTLNGYDIKSDILLNHAEQVTFTGNKRIDNLRVHNLRCSEPCIIQGVDFVEWFANSVRLDRNHTIDGITYLEGITVLGGIESYGPVNNVTFDSQHLLLKSIPQTLEGSLYLKTKFPEYNLIYPSSIETLEVSTINDKDFNRFMDNLVRDENGTVTLGIPVTLVQNLKAKIVETGESKIFGVNINQLLQEVEYGDQLSQYESKLRSLHMVGQSLVETFNTKTPYLSHYQPIKNLPGYFRSVATITLPLSPMPIELLAVHVDDGNRTAIDFYRWNKKDSRFRIAKGFPSISSPTLLITKMKRIMLSGVQNLFVEYYDQQRQIYRQSILDLDAPDFLAPKKTPKFISIYDFNSSSSMDIVSLKILDLDCVGLYTHHIDGLNVYCLHLENLVYYLKFHQLLTTPAVKQALYLDGRLVVLSRDNLLQVWRPRTEYKLGLFQLIKIAHPTYLTLAKFEQQLFVAINSEQALTDAFAHHGSIEIWRDQRPLHPNSTFTKYQTILTKVPKQIQFSVLTSTSELMLYTLTENPFHPLVMYRYEGVAGFREYLTSNALRTSSKRFAVIKMDRKQQELLALLGDREITWIEAVIKGK